MFAYAGISAGACTPQHRHRHTCLVTLLNSTEWAVGVVVGAGEVCVAKGDAGHGQRPARRVGRTGVPDSFTRAGVALMGYGLTDNGLAG